MRTPTAQLACVGVLPLPQTKFGDPETRISAEECMAEAIFCLDQASRCDNARAQALCLGLAALWRELAMLAARLDAQGTA